MKCKRCREQAVVGLPSHNTAFCEPCFLLFFRRQVETAIRRQKLFTHKDRILVALSGGKDSLALMLELGQQKYDVTGLHIDLGIGESSRNARSKVEAFCEKHGFPLRVVEMEAEGLAMPLVKEHIKRPVCSVCGKVKRHYFNKVARDEGFNVLATGHNLDDEVARLFANTLRWDTSYLSDQGPLLPESDGFARKVKPLFRLTEFETANYAFLQGIEIHSDPCPFSTGATFTAHKRLWADLEQRSPGQKFGFYDKFLKNGKPAFAQMEKEFGAQLRPCAECGSPTSAELCGVCRVRQMLAEKMLPEETL
ncbi:MAG: ATP-binding protein [Desulfovibrio sp.]|nr:ATP-binding protein [Desulfovibrio sp.]